MRNPREVAYGDRAGAGTWATYWYENTKQQKKSDLSIYANDGVDNAPADKNGFESWSATVGAVKRTSLPFLNPQTQLEIVRSSWTSAEARREARRAGGADQCRCARRTRPAGAGRFSAWAA